MASYDRQKKRAQKMIRKYGKKCAIYVPSRIIGGSGANPIYGAPVTYDNVYAVFESVSSVTGRDNSIKPETLVPEAQRVAYIAALDLPIPLDNTHQLIVDGKNITILAFGTVAPDYDPIMYTLQLGQ